MKTVKKQPKQLDYTFKVRDFEKSYNKHLKTAQRHGYINLPDLKNWLDPYIEELILDNITRNWMAYDYRYAKPAKEQGFFSQKQLKQLKAHVNSEMYTVIVSNLEFNDKPKSTATAFYMANYEKINEIMEDCARNVLHNLGYDSDTGMSLSVLIS